MVEDVAFQRHFLIANSASVAAEFTSFKPL